jgi:hypothetical protein
LRYGSDSSDSMRYGRKKIYKKAIAIADKYLAKGKNVAVFNFGCRSIITDFSKNKCKIYRSIKKYQGGPTILNTTLLGNLTEDYRGSLHINVISDMDIFNFKDFIAFVKEFSKNYQEKFLNSLQINLLYSSNEDDHNIKDIKEEKLQEENVSILPLFKKKNKTKR